MLSQLGHFWASSLSSIISRLFCMQDTEKKTTTKKSKPEQEYQNTRRCYSGQSWAGQWRSINPAGVYTVLGGVWGSVAGYRFFTSISHPHTPGSHFICCCVRSRLPWFDLSRLIGAFSAFLWVSKFLTCSPVCNCWVNAASPFSCWPTAALCPVSVLGFGYSTKYGSYSLCWWETFFFVWTATFWRSGSNKPFIKQLISVFLV